MKNPQTNFKRMPRALLSGIFLLLIVAIPARGQMKDSSSTFDRKLKFLPASNHYKTEIYVGYSPMIHGLRYKFRDADNGYTQFALSTSPLQGVYGLRFSFDNESKRRGYLNPFTKNKRMTSNKKSWAQVLNFRHFGVDYYDQYYLMEATQFDPTLNNKLTLRQSTWHFYTARELSDNVYINAGYIIGLVGQYQQQIGGLVIDHVDEELNTGSFSMPAWIPQSLVYPSVGGYELGIGRRFFNDGSLFVHINQTKAPIYIDLELKRFRFFETVDPNRENFAGYFWWLNEERSTFLNRERLNSTSYTVSVKLTLELDLIK